MKENILKKSRVAWDILLYGDGKFIYQLAKEKGLTYSHISKLLKELRNQKLLTLEKDEHNKRIVIIKLTKDGREICNTLRKIEAKLWGE